MKRFTVLLIIMLVTSFITGCFDGGGDDDKDKVTTGSIEVKATYTDSITDANTGGTEKIFLWLFKEAPANARTEADYEITTESAAASGTEYTLTIDEIEPGDYYVMLFYDDKLHNQGDAGNTDPYVFYNNAKNPTTAARVTIEKDSTKELTISFDDTYLIGSDAAFMTDPTGGTGTATLTVNGTYSGTSASVDAKCYVYLWSTAPSQPNDPYSYTAASTSNIVTTDSYSITVEDIEAGDYYVMIIYDFNTNNAPNKNDKYEMYEDVSAPGTATKVSITSGESKSISMSFGDSFKILDGNLFQ